MLLYQTQLDELDPRLRGHDGVVKIQGFCESITLF